MKLEVNKMLFVVLALLLLQSCAGQDGRNGVNGSDGQNGINGSDGVSAELPDYIPTALVLPCAANPESPTASELNNPNYEVLIRVKNGMLLASYSSSNSAMGTHLSTVPPGRYTSTANISCVFIVTEDLQVLN